MKLSISNIGWDKKDNKEVYSLMQKYGFVGLEIAPTKVYPENPYQHLEEAVQWKRSMSQTYGFEISSMQSIWYGRQEQLFGDANQRKVLFDYTKEAILFAESISCHNLVLGCPKNRNVPSGTNSEDAKQFFFELGEYAVMHNTVIGMEANPTIYNTNYINTTKEAIELIQEIDSKGFRLNLDIGTMIQNDEDIECLEGKVTYINHVHVSEPWLKPIEKRSIHNEIKSILEKEGYDGFISIEMGTVDNINVLEERLQYVRSIFA